MEITRRLVGLGLSYHTAPVEFRERARCTLSQLNEQRLADRKYTPICELVSISTCNRLELYAAIDCSVPSTVARDGALLLELLAETCALIPSTLTAHSYVMNGVEAQLHLSRVASGLESMVLGEPQILGQVIDAYEVAVAAHSIGPVVTATMRSAIRAGKRAHSETKISRKPASISSVAVAMGAKRLGRLHECRVVVIGVGEMGMQTLKSLQARRVASVTVVNRTVTKATILAEQFGYTAAGLDRLGLLLADADLVISATGASDAIIDRKMVAHAMKQRADRPLLLIDIALPRDVHPSAGDVDGVQLADIDELTTACDDARKSREREVPQVEAIVADEAGRFAIALQQLAVEPVIADLRRKAESIRVREVERTLRFIGADADPDTVKHIHHLTRALVNKLLHDPTVTLKQKASDGDGGAYVEALQELFALSDVMEQRP